MNLAGRNVATTTILIAAGKTNRHDNSPDMTVHQEEDGATSAVAEEVVSEAAVADTVGEVAIEAEEGAVVVAIRVRGLVRYYCTTTLY